jgi:hypothetical protein
MMTRCRDARAARLPGRNSLKKEGFIPKIVMRSLAVVMTEEGRTRGEKEESAKWTLLYYDK